MRDWEKLSDLPVITVNYLLMENKSRILVCLAPNSISSTIFVYFTPLSVVDIVMYCLDAPTLVMMDLLP